MAEHTPGPWTARSRSVGVGPLDDYDNDFLGWEIVGPPESQRGQFERGADARLIAAAPEMYEALVSLFGAEFLEDTGPAWNQARAALAKAEGRQP